jgi:anaerobic magnesium-protoporphyrin IX monomethyl ester cyclase
VAAVDVNLIPTRPLPLAGAEVPERYIGVQQVQEHRSTRFTLVLPRTESMRSSAVSMAGAEHLGLGSIAAYLRLQGYSVTQLNYQLSTFFNAWDGLSDPRSSYSAEAIAAEILDTEPDVVGICVTSMTLLESIRICELVRAARPQTVLGLGGPHAILCAKDLMATFDVLDFIGLNDGERAMSLIGDALTRGVFPCVIPEAITRADHRDRAVLDEYRRTPKGVDHLPVPARDDLLWMLLRAPISEARITTSRGCNYDCTFCIDAMRYERMWYARSAVQTVHEMEMLNRRLGITHFWMSDDNYITGAPVSRRRAVEIADLLAERELDVTYRVRFRSDTFVHAPGLLARLAESGLVAAFVGLEAGSAEQLERFKKRTTVDQHKVCVAQMREQGIALQCGFIMYEPYASFDDLEASATFLCEIDEMYLESNFTHSLDVFPGTEIADDMARDGLLHPGFDATSPYDAYDFNDPAVGALAKAIELSHNPDTVTRDKWLYRYRTNLLPRAYRALRGHRRLDEWKRREQATIRRLNDGNMAFFTGAIAEGRRGEGGRRYGDLIDRAWEIQRAGEAELRELYREVSDALPAAAAPSGLPAARVARSAAGDAADDRSRAPVLPPRVVARLRLAEERVAQYGPFRHELLSGGNLNHTVLLTGEQRSFVFRAPREQPRQEVEAYLRELYGQGGMTELGGSFRLRSVPEEVAAIERARAAGVRTPAVLAWGGDWSVRDHVPGRPLGDVLGEGGSPAHVLRLLFQLMEAHRHGVVLGDRWGYNEILDGSGHLHLIDFDVVWDGPADGGLADMDMAVALFGALLFTGPIKDHLLEAMREYGIPLLAQWGYDLSVIARVLSGYCDFYGEPGKRSTALSLDPAVYLASLPAIQAVIDLCRSATPLTTAVGCVR